MKRCLIAAEINLTRLISELDALTPDINAGKDVEGRGAYPLISCIGFIDFANRFGTLIDSLPIKKDHPKIQKLRRVLKVVREARNHLQHLDQELSDNSKIEYALLGALSWERSNTVYSMFASQPGSNASVPSISYDLKMRCWTARNQFSIKDSTINLDSTLAEMRHVYEGIVKGSKTDQIGLFDLKWGPTRALRFQIELPPSKDL